MGGLRVARREQSDVAGLTAEDQAAQGDRRGRAVSAVVGRAGAVTPAVAEALGQGQHRM
jgi:hypothetical protein